ncbi:MAG: NAD(P)H-binding protein [Bryobacteraceae bacterium]|nr:NAD(P)H-binding protein [Bryobacteraceae bacterium]
MRGNGTVFVSGATGYLGRPLICALLERGHSVRALARPGSESRVPRGADVMLGNALDAASLTPALDAGTTLVHLTGAPKPAPWKGRQFRAVDEASLRASLEAACRARIAHLVYVSVAQPAPVMRTYIKVRRECEEAIRAGGIPATLLRPWYVVGEGHRWPLCLIPCYKLAEWFPLTRQGALRLGLLRHEEMTRGLVWAVENPPATAAAGRGEPRVLTVPDIRALCRLAELPSPAPGEVRHARAGN